MQHAWIVEYGGRGWAGRRPEERQGAAAGKGGAALRHKAEEAAGFDNLRNGRARAAGVCIRREQVDDKTRDVIPQPL